MRHVLVVGAGGIGCPAISVLRRSGVEHITVLDPDVVSLENLHRQILFSETDVGASKADLVGALPGVDSYAVKLTEENGAGWIAGKSCVIDGTDNFADKYRINDLCLEAGVPLVHAGGAQFRGQVLVVRPGGPCLRCLLPEPPDAATDECRWTGVFGPAVGTVAAIAAAEAIRVMGGSVAPPSERLFLVDLARGRIRRAALAPQSGCACAQATPLSA